MTKLGILATSAVALSSALCYGSIEINPGDGYVAGEEEVWGSWKVDTTFGGSATAALGDYGVPQGNYLQLTLSGPGPVIFYTDAATATHGRFTGALRPNGIATFKLLNSGTSAPDELGLYFRSSVSHNSWVRYVIPTDGTDWQPYYGLALNQYKYDDPYLVGWGLVDSQSGDNSAAQLLTDLGSVDRFGVWVTGSGGQTFGLDDVGIIAPGPEPETVWLLMAALTSLGVTFRGKIGETVRGLVKRT